MLYKSELLTLELWYIVDEYCCMGPSGRFYSCICIMMLLGTGDVLWVDLPVKRRLCLIFVNSVRLIDIHEYSAG